MQHGCVCAPHAQVRARQIFFIIEGKVVINAGTCDQHTIDKRSAWLKKRSTKRSARFKTISTYAIIFLTCNFVYSTSDISFISGRWFCLTRKKHIWKTINTFQRAINRRSTIFKKRSTLDRQSVLVAYFWRRPALITTLVETHPISLLLSDHQISTAQAKLKSTQFWRV